MRRSGQVPRSKYFSQLVSKVLRKREYQFRLQHLLQEIIVIPIVGIEVLAADDLEYASVTLAARALPDGIQRLVETDMAETLIQEKHLRDAVCKVLQVRFRKPVKVGRLLMDRHDLVVSDG